MISTGPRISLAFPAVGEMLTLVMQEAMACGLPVVATDEPDYAAYRFGPDDIAFVPADTAGLKRALQSLLHDRARLARMRVSGPAKYAAERFEWRAERAQLMSFYQGTIASATGTDQSDADESEDAQVSRTTRRPH